MTEQVPHILVNEHTRVNLKGLRLERIIRGDPSSNHGWGEEYGFENRPDVPHDNEVATSCYRGYVATFRLRTNGTLHLTRYTYWPDGKETSVTVKEQLSGDFWMVMTREFFGPRTYVPFHVGEIVEDRAVWRDTES
ncbi:hypothetical protein [Enhygromyxa salina]|uniref:Uncharacterized protein n=1 Tax=Enhygromyxa salina TaxID=215803 RepID=A0A2S9YIM4_9BACT|nr:hypothetical protein [Enhygromyxa salina]PRQ04876.1 hypothetical protein ENSA7_50490 [Enhygromyxa salina]